LENNFEINIPALLRAGMFNVMKKPPDGGNADGGKVRVTDE